MSSFVELQFWQISISVSLFIVMILLSLLFKVKMETSIVVAGLRMIVQLLIVGYLLEEVFQVEDKWLVLLICFAMIAIAIHANSQRVSARPPFFWISSAVSISLCVVLTLSFAMTFVIQPDPWYNPRYLIPFLGLIIGNTLTGVSLGMSSIIHSMDDHRDQIDTFLALGALPTEAGSHFLRQAIRTALTPILNGMTITGLVALPGVMTGQIPAGAPPAKAAQYQIAIMSILGFSTVLGSTLSVFFFYKKQFTHFNQLRRS